MQVQELTTGSFLSHLRRHPIPEIMDDTCLRALSSIETQYGNVITHGAGLEVRLGEDARYVDYIMNIDEGAIPGIESLWYEVDYAEFYKAYAENGRIAPCLFANIGFDPDDKAAWDKFLPPFLGEDRAIKLRGALNNVLEKLPKGSYIKQIGTMTGRGELSIMRLVIMLSSWEMISKCLSAIGWQGDATKLQDALAPWKEARNAAVNIDLGENGVLEKIGIEVFSRWRHPLLVSNFISRLEEAGLCLASKGEALRRWIRISPDGDPFIQTLISYFKLNYKDGKITEAKAYLEQSPYIHHHYFEAYERPVRLDIELTNGQVLLPRDTVLDHIREGRENRLKLVRLYGAERYEHLKSLQAALNDSGISAEIVINTYVEREQLKQMHEAGNTGFIVEIGSHTPETEGIKVLSLLQELNISPVRARWYMCAENAGELEDIVYRVKSLGVTDLLITGMCADKPGQKFPDREDIIRAAEFINSYDSSCGMTLTVDSCFSPLRAYMGGKDPKQNANRGITRGCEAGRSFMAIRADGKFTPCLKLITAGEPGTLENYWEQSAIPESLRCKEEIAACANCTYERRCLPCPAISSCPIP